MNSSKIKLALIGIGGYGRTYLNYILDKNDERIETVGLVEPYPQSASRMDEVYSKNIPVYQSADLLYKSTAVDLSVIASPIHFHTRQIIEALKNHSHVLCEKPLCADERDIELIIDEKNKSGLSCCIGYQWSYSAAINSLKRDIISGKLGKCRSMKTMVLWKRDRAYYERGSRWAGKIALDDGTLIYDSIANNAAAHYLHNLLFLMGDLNASAEPHDICAELYRANSIENFDSAKITFTLKNQAKALFLAAHPVDKNFEPVFEMDFDKGKVCYCAKRTADSIALMPKEYTDYQNIVFIPEKGEKTVYGDPFANDYLKLDCAIRLAMGDKSSSMCSIEAAAVHTRLINHIQKNFNIKNFDPSLIRERGNLVYVDGLYERMLEIYKNPALSII